MRHKINLPDQPNAVFLIIVFDIFILVGVYGLYGSNWVGQAGHDIVLPSASTAPLTISQNHIIVKVFSETTPTCIVGKKAIPYEKLSEELAKSRDTLNIEEVLLMIDVEASIQREREVVAIIQSLGLKCSLIAEPE